MSDRSISRALLRFGALATAAVLTFGVASTAAFAQDETTTTPPVSTTEPTPEPPTTEPTPPSEPPVETPSSTPTTEAPTPEPEKPSEKPAETQPEKPAETQQPEQPQVQKAKTQADLKVTVDFDQEQYQPETDLGVTVVISNVGDAPAENIRLSYDADIWLKSGIGELGSRPTLLPGQQKTIKVVGAARYSGNPTARFYLRANVDGELDPTPKDNEATDTAKITQGRGEVSALVYTDRNGNGAADPGEGASGVTFSAKGGAPFRHLFGQTNAEGVIYFTDVPAGKYVVEFFSSTVVVAPGQSEFKVADKQNTDLRIATAKPVGDVLTAAVAFDRDTYAKGDAVTVAVTLTNSGQAPLNNVVAVCNPYGNPGDLTGTGPGWTPLSPDGPGISLAAGETKVLAIPDVVPDKAFEAGSVGVSCNFGNNGRFTNGYRGASDHASVPGYYGVAKGRLVNAETGEPIVNVKIVAINPDTRRIITGTMVGYEGHFELSWLPAGKIEFIVVGPWKNKDGGAFTADIVGGKDNVFTLNAVPGPTPTDPDQYKPDLEIKAEFHKPLYDLNEPVQVKVVMRNIGQGTGTWSRVELLYPESLMDYDHGQWGDLLSRGLLLAPGESREVTLTGTAPYFMTNGNVAFGAKIVNAEDPNQANNSVLIGARATFVAGSTAVTLFGDRNENGKQDADEELAGATVNLEGGKPGRYRVSTTGADGRAVFDLAPAGQYVMRADLPDGWVMADQRQQMITIFPGVETPYAFRAVRPLSDEVPASITFDRSTYQPGDKVGLDVTLTNNSDTALTFKTTCGGDAAYALGNYGPQWGPLAWDSAGLTLAVGETRTVHVVENLPEAAPDHGLVAVYCNFVPEGQQADGSPNAKAKAKVPGAVWTTSGRVNIVQEGGPVANTPLVLLDKFTGKVIARTTTGADGGFTFPDLPVGEYTPVVVGPWKVVSTRSGPLFAAVRGSQYPQEIFVEPGPEVADPGFPERPLPWTPGNTPPAGGGTPADALAKTGASVLGLSVVGGLLMAFGIGARLATRRRVTA